MWYMIIYTVSPMSWSVLGDSSPLWLASDAAMTSSKTEYISEEVKSLSTIATRK